MTPPTPVPWTSLIAAIAAISVAGIGFGHSLPLFSILLKGYGAADGVIGLNASTAALASILVTPIFPKLITQMGQKAFLLTCIGIMVAGYGALYAVGGNIALWYPIRFVFGAAAAGLFVASEIWINTIAPAPMRGRIIGIYGTCLALGFAVGPMMIELVGHEGPAPFIAGAVIFGAAAIPILMATNPPVASHGAATGFFQLMARAPATYLSAALFAGVETSVLIFLPVLAIDLGWGVEVGARSVTAYGLGIVSLQYVIGRWSDRFGYGRSLLVCAIGSALGALALLLVGANVMGVYLVLFLWGGMIAGLYTVGLTLIGDRFDAANRAAANTGFVFAYGVGAVILPLVAGVVRQIAGAQGLNLFLLASLSAYAVLVWFRRREQLP